MSRKVTIPPLFECIHSHIDRDRDSGCWIDIHSYLSIYLSAFLNILQEHSMEAICLCHTIANPQQLMSSVSDIYYQIDS